MIRFVSAHRDRFGVELICGVLQATPSTYYAAPPPGAASAGRCAEGEDPEVGVTPTTTPWRSR